jgi:hypothetical protein
MSGFTARLPGSAEMRPAAGSLPMMPEGLADVR